MREQARWGPEGGPPGELAPASTGRLVSLRPAGPVSVLGLALLAAGALSRSASLSTHCQGWTVSLPTPGPRLQLFLQALCHHAWPVAPTRDLTRETLGSTPWYGLGFPAWCRGCSRRGHTLLLQQGSCWGRRAFFPHTRLLLCKAVGPGDLGELLFKARVFVHGVGCQETLRPGASSP